MNWDHVWLIFARELRDQLRDRRTLFTIAILPMLLYPIMGMLMLQVTQFHRENQVTVAILGAEHWPEDQPLVRDGKLAEELLDNAGRKLIDFKTLAYPSQDVEPWRTTAKSLLEKQESDLVLVVHPGFAEQLSAVVTRTSSKPGEWISVMGNRANEKSQIADRRMRTVLDEWQKQWTAKRLEEANLSPNLVRPLKYDEIDVAPAASRSALVWSKLLPFVMLIWALTGAFYPAIDLCAGEKERGTLETLLSGPATRREIVWGKLLTVMCFSVATALLNLVSMQVTASLVMKQFLRLGSSNIVESLGPLPVNAIGWLIIMLLPMSALFSALAMAVAALARSSKEGQYYLMPLLLVAMPLVMVPMLPGTTLTIGTSIIPVTGAVLLSRALLEGQYHEALLHLPFVVAVTGAACLMAIRWAVRQFESESVLFRESERLDLAMWLRHLWRDRGQTASTPEALLCGMIILVALFFGRLMAADMSLQWSSIAKSTIVIQLGMILSPCLIMATMLTRSLREAFRIHLPRLSDLIVSIALAFCLHPTYLTFMEFVRKEYSIGADTEALLKHVDQIIGAAPLSAVLFFLAVLPACCEELAFRGFIFGGLLTRKAVPRAIVISSLFFGLSHGVLQQSIGATIIGIGLGIIAWRSGTVLCSIAFHVVHNGLGMVLVRIARSEDGMPQSLGWFFKTIDGQLTYSDAWMTLSPCLALAGFAWFLFRKNTPAVERRMG